METNTILDEERRGGGEDGEAGGADRKAQQYTNESLLEVRIPLLRLPDAFALGSTTQQPCYDATADLATLCFVGRALPRTPCSNVSYCISREMLSLGLYQLVTPAFIKRLHQSLDRVESFVQYAPTSVMSLSEETFFTLSLLHPAV